MSLRGGGKKKKFTEYIDFFYSLHHLYKYIEPQKTNKEKLLRKKEKRKQRNTETHNSSKANKAREERESSDRIHERDRGAEKDRRQFETWREGGAAGESGEYATVPYENL